ncbi:hypothetical protein CYLTODRAFT_361175, partial [Cylindrobasidium torrendii FP15055 ss-10]
ADIVIIFDSDCNPQNGLQAMACTHRIRQKSHVGVYGFKKDAVEEEVLERVKNKMILEYAIIHQMDTTQAHLSAKGKESKETQKRDDLTQTGVLKSGAQNIFKKDNKAQAQKLDEMDLDEILTRAEDHETMDADAGTSLGGEDFLANYKNINDMAAMDLDWDEIVPAEEQMEEFRNCMRTAAKVFYEGVDVDQPPSLSANKQAKVAAPARRQCEGTRWRR